MKHDLPDGPTVILNFEIHTPDGALIPEWTFSTAAEQVHDFRPHISQ